MVGEGKAERERPDGHRPHKKIPAPWKVQSNASHLNHRMFRVRTILFKRRQTIYQSWDFPHIPLRHTIVHCLFECIQSPGLRILHIVFSRYCSSVTLTRKWLLQTHRWNASFAEKICSWIEPKKKKKMKQYSSNRWWDQMSTEGPIEICRKPSCFFLSVNVKRG